MPVASATLPDQVTLEEARDFLQWTTGDRSLGKRLRDLGYRNVMRFHEGASARGRQRVWTKIAISHDGTASCTCRCHTGTCGENAMMLAERTIRVIQKLRPMDVRMIEAIERIVDAAGVDFARVDLMLDDADEVPF